MDRRIMQCEAKGKEVPTRELIKTPEQIEGIRRAGVVNTGVLDEVAKQIHAGMSTLEIDEICMQYCKDHNATPACLNYEGFPKSVCTSINEVVCHGIPKAEDILEEGDIINVDFTTILDGYYADASRMFIISRLSYGSSTLGDFVTKRISARLAALFTSRSLPAGKSMSFL